MKLFIGDCLSVLPWFIGAVTATGASTLNQKPSMKTSDGQRTKARDAQLIKALDGHQRTPYGARVAPCDYGATPVARAYRISHH